MRRYWGGGPQDNHPDGRTVGQEDRRTGGRSDGNRAVVLSAAKDLHVQVLRSLRSLRTTSLSPVCPSAVLLSSCPPVRLSDVRPSDRPTVRPSDRSYLPNEYRNCNRCPDGRGRHG